VTLLRPTAAHCAAIDLATLAQYASPPAGFVSQEPLLAAFETVTEVGWQSSAPTRSATQTPKV
jgi:hypothetical protein